MKLTPIYLRSLITEVLNEKLYGKLAILYTASKSPPEEYVPIVNGDIVDPGKVTGAVYGKGLYTVYDEKNSDMKTHTFSGKYGRYIYKIKQNISNFICFDEEPCIKVWGSSFSPYEQAIKAIGKTEVIKKERITIEEDFALFKKLPAKNGKYEDGTYSESVAKKFVKIFKGMMSGVMFTHDPEIDKDGSVCVVFDPSSSLIIEHGDLLGDTQKKLFATDKIEPIYDKIEDIEWTRADLSSSKTVSYKTPDTSRFDAKNKEQKINTDIFANDYHAFRELTNKKNGRTYEMYYPEIAEKTKSTQIATHIYFLTKRIPEEEISQPDSARPMLRRREYFESINSAIYKNKNFTFDHAVAMGWSLRRNQRASIKVGDYTQLSPKQMLIDAVVSRSPKTAENVKRAMDIHQEGLYGITQLLYPVNQIDEEIVKNVIIPHPYAEISGILKKVALEFPQLIKDGLLDIEYYYQYLRENVDNYDETIRETFPDTYENVLFYFLSSSKQEIVDNYMEQFQWRTHQQTEFVKNWNTWAAPFLIRIVLGNLKRLLSRLNNPDEAEEIYESTLRAVNQNTKVIELMDKRKSIDKSKGLEKQIIDKILDFPIPDGWEIITNDDLLSNILTINSSSKNSIDIYYEAKNKFLEFSFYIKPKGELKQILLNPDSLLPLNINEAEEALKDYMTPLLTERGLKPLDYVEISKSTQSKIPCYEYSCGHDEE